MLKDARNTFGYIVQALKDGGGGVHEYNYRVFEGEYNFDFLETYLNRDDVKAKYGAHSDYKNMNWDVFERFDNDYINSAAPALGYVLEHISVLVYNGQDDLVVNTPGVQRYLSKVQWRGQDGFNSLEFSPWTIQKQNTGLMKSYDNLTFVIVNKAGHLVPLDMLASSYDMLDRYITCLLYTSPSPRDS
eukprot:TRINITY_DN14760_c0_g1_i2.p1 TRINITY_DN14760_c0_g1~~TRINITY_DN14760_c0_g1_i2.p1  ORF type:complete len:188 (+),score=36.79 TRINITY_DN14760_c0_g1_i2:578-1141(+)